MALFILKNVHIAKNNAKILNGISLNISQGEFINIMGPSGGGKSTLLKTLNSLEGITEGELYYFNQDIRSLDPLILRKEVGYVFQTPFLFGEKVIENIEYPLHLHKINVEDEYIEKMLMMLNLKPEILYKNCKDLSVGEQQRICFIRTLVLRPKVLLLDEITSALDPNNTRLVEDFIRQIYHEENLTILLVTHSIEQAKRMGKRTILIVDGKIQKDQVTQDFFSDSDYEDRMNSELLNV